MMYGHDYSGNEYTIRRPERPDKGHIIMKKNYQLDGGNQVGVDSLRLNTNLIITINSTMFIPSLFTKSQPAGLMKQAKVKPNTL